MNQKENKDGGQPLVSVIVPVCNGERYLGECLESILAQTFRAFETIVVDDGSVDGSARIVRAFTDVRLISQQNQGQSVARNVGILAARGELLAFNDADDLWPPNKLGLQVDHLLAHPEIDYVIGRMINFLEEGTARPVWLDQKLISGDFTGYSPGTLMTRRSVFRKIGMFDPAFKHACDLDWFFRAKDAEIPMAVIPELLLYRRVHGHNYSYERQFEGSPEMIQVVRSSIHRARQKKGARPR